MSKIYYFAYGSNLLQSRLEERIGKVERFHTHNLKNWKLVFNVSSKGMRPFANIVEQEGEHVNGVMYEVTPLQLKELSFYEALYYQYMFPYLDGVAVMFLGLPRYTRKTKLFPDIIYLSYIIKGSDEKRLPCKHLIDIYSKAKIKQSWRI